ncbi:ATP-grasp domain-containing protein [Streptomyces sp. NBC_01304]|uniref:ATP-grasp domain-containing protein n=1 Tax=Streptomyces sp. NBC_01304 TaxID=2903818 RepID=UPI002E0D2745|nr:ATP-grasp domain-containing protein [Streptomyces sp. NBC_01304]
MTENTQPVLLVLGAGDEAYRSFALAEFAAQHRLVLIDNEPSAWAALHVAEQVIVDLHDRQATELAIKEIATHHTVAGITTYLETHVELAAHLAAALQLPGADPAAVTACRDKARTRQLLAEHRVPSARSYTVTSEADAIATAQAVGYPVVVKPRGMAGSSGVRRADSPEDVIAHYRAATTVTLMGLEINGAAGVLVEEYLDGPEISAECVVTGPGDIHIVAITRKSLSAEPAFLETAHLVDARDPLLTDASVRTVVNSAVNAVGINRGVLHVELRLTARGARIIEINARMGGDLIPRLVQLATGIRLPQISAALATGAEPDLTVTRQQSAAIEFHYPKATGRLDAVHSDISGHWVERQVWTHQTGDHVRSGTDATIGDRLGHLVVTGPTPASCSARLRQAEQHLHIRIATPAYVTACVR